MMPGILHAPMAPAWSLDSPWSLAETLAMQDAVDRGARSADSAAKEMRLHRLMEALRSMPNEIGPAGAAEIERLRGAVLRLHEELCIRDGIMKPRHISLAVAASGDHGSA